MPRKKGSKRASNAASKATAPHFLEGLEDWAPETDTIRVGTDPVTPQTTTSETPSSGDDNHHESTLEPAGQLRPSAGGSADMLRLREEVVELRKRLHHESVTVFEYEKRHVEDRNEIDGLRNENERHSQENERLGQEKQMLTQKVEAFQSHNKKRVQETKANFKHKDKVIQEQRQRNELLEREHVEVRERLETELKTGQEQKLKLGLDLSEAQKVKERLETELIEVREKLETELGTEQEQKVKLEFDLSEAQKELREVSKQSQRELRRLNEKLESEQEKQVRDANTLANVEQRLKDKVLEAEQQRESLNTKLHAMETRKKQLDKDVAETKDQLEQAQTQHEREEQRLRKERCVAEQNQKCAEKKAAALEKKAAALVREREEVLLPANDQANEESRKLTEKCRELGAEADVEIARLNQRLQSVQVERDQLNHSNKQFETRLSKTERFNEDLKAEKAPLSAELKKVKAELEAKEGDMELLARRRDEVVDDLKAKIHDTERLAEGRAEHVKNLKMKLDERDRRMEREKTLVKDLQTKLQRERCDKADAERARGESLYAAEMLRGLRVGDRALAQRSAQDAALYLAYIQADQILKQEQEEDFRYIWANMLSSWETRESALGSEVGALKESIEAKKSRESALEKELSGLQKALKHVERSKTELEEINAQAARVFTSLTQATAANGRSAAATITRCRCEELRGRCDELKQCLSQALFDKNASENEKQGLELRMKALRADLAATKEANSASIADQGTGGGWNQASAGAADASSFHVENEVNEGMVLSHQLPRKDSAAVVTPRPSFSSNKRPAPNNGARDQGHSKRPAPCNNTTEDPTHFAPKQPRNFPSARSAAQIAADVPTQPRHVDEVNMRGQSEDQSRTQGARQNFIGQNRPPVRPAAGGGGRRRGGRR